MDESELNDTFIESVRAMLRGQKETVTIQVSRASASNGLKKKTLAERLEQAARNPKPYKKDDLTIVDGIDRVAQKLLFEAGVFRLFELSILKPRRLKAILSTSGKGFDIDSILKSAKLENKKAYFEKLERSIAQIEKGQISTFSIEEFDDSENK